MAANNLKHGTCPYLSTLVPFQGAPPGNGDIVRIDNKQIGGITLFAPCNGSDCQLWDHYANVCSIKSTPFTTEALQSMQPPNGGQMSRLVDAVERLVEIVQEKRAG